MTANMITQLKDDVSNNSTHFQPVLNKLGKVVLVDSAPGYVGAAGYGWS
jgi:hypothetical protein